MTCIRTEQVLALLADYALDPLGKIDGLTTHEFAWAWKARHRTAPPMRTLYLLSEAGDVRDAMRRHCVVSGKRVRAWVPRRFAT